MKSYKTLLMIFVLIIATISNSFAYSEINKVGAGKTQLGNTMLKDNTQKVSYGMVTAVGGSDDQSRNNASLRGLERLADYGEISVMRSDVRDDYLAHIGNLVEDNVDLIYGATYTFAEPIKEVAQLYPNQKFAIVDTVVDEENVLSILFAEHEASFLAGVAAGMATKTDTVAFIGGMRFPLIEKFEYGFKAGVKAVNPQAKIYVSYVESFHDSDKGRQFATEYHEMGVDVIYHCAGNTGVGIIEASKIEDFWSIGCDIDQSYLAPDNVLCSMVKNYDEAVYQVGKSLAEGTFTSGIKVFSVAHAGVGISDNGNNLSEEILRMIDIFTQGIKNGNIIVPQTEKEFEHFMATW